MPAVAGLPIGLFSFRPADPLLVHLGVGATILARTQTRDLAAGAVAGVATALVGMAGPPVLTYLLLAGTAAQTVRATLFAFFALSYRAQSHPMPRPPASLAPPGWLPASSCPSPCSAALPGGRSETASAAAALPFWRSRCSPSPGFMLWPPRVSVLSLANRENLGAAHRDY